MSDDQNKPEQTPAQTSNNEPTPVPASKLIPTKRSTLLWMLGVLIIGILVILWAWRIWAFCHKCAAN
ncbi:multidrug resistance efflux pump [Acinetobacter baumannii]|nr:multidrug resistance efflux pump [Acinetobacter baumannii]